MGWSSQTNIGYSNGNFFTYGGYGQFVARANPSVEFLRRLQLPNATPVLLATIEVGWLLVAGRNLALGLGSFTIPDYPLKTVRVNGAGNLPTPPETEGFVTTFGYNAFAPSGGVRQVDVYFLPDNTSNANAYVAIYHLSFANVPKTFRGIDWEPRIAAAPNLALRIERRFGGPVGQVGGGRLQLLNADAYFDKLDQASWDVGLVTFEYGLDLPGAAMAETDYLSLGTWRVENADRNDTHLTLNLRELKTRIEAEIPFELLSRTDYAALDNDRVGEPIPIAYGHIFGAPAIVLDRAGRRLKVALHRIHSFDAVRIKKELTSAEDVIVPATDFASYSANTYVTNFTQRILNVLFGATELIEKNSIASVDATAGSWYRESDLLYLRPPAGQAIAAQTITVRQEISYEAWVSSSFASVDLVKAEFTLGPDWDRSADVSVDFQGRIKPDGTLMENWADIVADLLDYLGEIKFDQESFSQSRRELYIGADRFGLEAITLAPSLYIRERIEARELLEMICETAGAFLFVDHAGAWRFNVYRPEMTSRLGNAQAMPPRSFTHNELLDPLLKAQDHREVFSRVSVNYARRHAEDWGEMLSETRRLNQVLHAINEIEPEEREPLLWRTEDARYFAQRLLSTEGLPVALYSSVLPRSALLLLPGDQIRLTHPRHGFIPPADYVSPAGEIELDAPFEVLTVDKDLLNGRVKVTLGERRAWRDSFGWWLIEDVTTPTIPPGAWTHLRAEGLRATDGERVAVWFNDFSTAPVGINGGMPTPGFQPIFRANQINGLPAVRFEGFDGSGRVDHILWQINGEIIFPNSAGEIFLIVKADFDPGVVGVDGLYRFGSTIDPTEYCAADGTLKETFGLAAQIATGVDPIPALTSWRLYNVSVDASAFTIRLDGTQIYTTGAHTVGFITGAYPRIGHSAAGATTSGFVGYIAECLSYPRVLSSSERASVNNYMATRFNLPVGSVVNTPVQWNRNWTNAQAAFARANYGWWHDNVRRVANLVADLIDSRAYEASRWW